MGGPLAPKPNIPTPCKAGRGVPAALAALLLAPVVYLVCRQGPGPRLLQATTHGRLQDDPLYHPWGEQIDRSLAPFRETGITQELLDKAYRKRNAARIQILNNIIYAEDENMDAGSSQLRKLLKNFQKLACRHKVPDVEFMLTWGDGPKAPKKSDPAPLFGWCLNTNAWDIAVPYVSFYQASYYPEVAFPYASPDIDWEAPEAQSELAYFRGATSGGPYTLETWREPPRARLVQLCHARPDLCDAEFTKYGGSADVEVAAVMQAELGTHEYEPFENNFRHRFNVVMDGNTVSSRRTLYLFGGPSLLLWQQSPYQEFFNSALRPYVHYLPLAYNLTDLYETIEWVRAHPVAVQSILDEARRFRKKYLNGLTVNKYLLDLLTQYAALQRFDPVRNPVCKPYTMQGPDAYAELLELSGGRCPLGNVSWE